MKNTIKNILVTYAGMLIGGDYVFSNLNFVGLTIRLILTTAQIYLLNLFNQIQFLSTISSLVYSYLTFSPKKQASIAENDTKDLKGINSNKNTTTV